MDRDFKGVWIPREIWLDEILGWSEKILLTEIDSLSSIGECFASNEYFGKFLNLSKDRVSKLISDLTKKGYIETKLTFKQGTKQVEKRVITTRGYRRKQLEGIGENNYTPIGENNYYINTPSINTINNTSIIDKPKNKTKSLTEFEKTIEDYKIMRKSLKKPMTDRAVELMLSKLDKLSKCDESIKIKILEQSIENSWLGIFELKQPQNNNYYSNNQPQQPTKGLMDLSDL